MQEAHNSPYSWYAAGVQAAAAARAVYDQTCTASAAGLGAAGAAGAAGATVAAVAAVGGGVAQQRIPRAGLCMDMVRARGGRAEEASAGLEWEIAWVRRVKCRALCRLGKTCGPSRLGVAKDWAAEMRQQAGAVEEMRGLERQRRQ